MAQSEGIKKRMKSRIGSIDQRETFDEFLEKEGLLAEIEDAAIKEIFAAQIKFTRTSST